METIHNTQNDRLFKAIMSLSSIEECYKFFEDICTIKELNDMSQRLKVAEMLDNQISYNEISKTTGASTTTISRVNRCLVYGNGGYKNVIDKLKSEDSSNGNK